MILPEFNEDTDIMNGLLLLSNVYRRIGTMKKTLQDDLALLQKTYLQKEKKAKAMVGRA